MGYAERIRQLRNERGWTQSQLADQVTAKGVLIHTSQVNKIELGDRAVKMDEFIALTEIFGVSADNLLGNPPTGHNKESLIFDATQVAQRSQWQWDSTVSALRRAVADLDGFTPELDEYEKELLDGYTQGCDTVALGVAAIREVESKVLSKIENKAIANLMGDKA